MKLRSKFRNACIVASAPLLASPAFATEGAGDIWASIDFAGIAAKVTAAGIAIIGIAMAFKGIQLAKRAVRSA
ncbi:phage coat protein [Vibrio sp. PID23_8]|uniref:phage coat protein n=1 Tax=Vibrio sp. PID23_8 TaxID=1583767 RepID=UPI000E67F48B|nr:phage coat protein [Vibrio sp. PID23_8]RIZ55154.1 hypothetical protein AK966_07420 [Vibrio sp. PID23_8]